MSLNIVPGDVLTQAANIFNPLWGLIVIGLGLLVAPRIIRVVKGVFSGGGKA